MVIQLHIIHLNRRNIMVPMCLHNIVVLLTWETNGVCFGVWDGVRGKFGGESGLGVGGGGGWDQWPGHG
jgi:hypothetical protein